MQVQFSQRFTTGSDLTGGETRIMKVVLKYYGGGFIVRRVEVGLDGVRQYRGVDHGGTLVR